MLQFIINAYVLNRRAELLTQSAELCHSHHFGGNFGTRSAAFVRLWRHHCAE